MLMGNLKKNLLFVTVTNSLVTGTRDYSGLKSFI